MAMETATRETATLGGGCFWCIEGAMRHLAGVSRAESGYAGGHVPNPSYEEVCGKKTGHAEVVQIDFDPAQVSYADLLRMFFTLHDPTTKDRQGNDVGPQYRSIILTHSPEQAQIAKEIIAEVDASGAWGGTAVTEVVPLTVFYPAEPEHQDYYARNPWSGYCRVVVGPKVAKFRKTFADRLKKGAA